LNLHYDQDRQRNPLPADVSEGAAEAARRSLPKGEAKRKARGWSMQEDGKAIPVDSGDRDSSANPDLYQQAVDHLKTAFPTDFFTYKSLAKHVEVKIAIDMLLHGHTTHQVVVMDRPVCGRLSDLGSRATCDKLLHRLLENTGSRLTVIEHDGRRVTYPKKDRPR
jgi:hypothetical protein